MSTDKGGVGFLNHLGEIWHLALCPESESFLFVVDYRLIGNLVKLFLKPLRKLSNL
jgi:hypothetical protein